MFISEKRMKISCFLILVLLFTVFVRGVKAGNDLYKKYEPADPRPVPKEGIDWNRFISYIPEKFNNNKPKILLIGDSICGGLNDSCSVPVQAKLGNTAYVAYWFTSKSCVDPDYIRALNIALEQYDYEIEKTDKNRRQKKIENFYDKKRRKAQ